MSSLDLHFAKKHKVLLKEVSEEAAQVIVAKPIALDALSELRRVLAVPLQITTIEEEPFQAMLASHYETDYTTAMKIAEDYTEDADLATVASQLPQAEDLLAGQDEAPIIRLLNALLSQAARDYASDIHIETYKEELVIRLRIDGVLREVLRPARVLAPLLISRIKVMAKLDIAEKRLPQDGRISIRVAGRSIDLRVSVIPTNRGERVVMRILDKHNAQLKLTALGLSSQMQDNIQTIINKPHGILLVTGPTGSGKTTTLYAALMQIKSSERNIMTVEDPIEYEISGISQTAVNNKVQMTFSKGLRAILRQDPDVVMIGEIRDPETARIAVQASLTGHLVLSTLHTNNALGAVTRMMDIGVEPFLLSSSLIACLAQRLVRVLCDKCKRADKASVSECHLLGRDSSISPTIYRATGCDACFQSGYAGRVGIYELLIIDEHMRNLIHNHASEQDLNQYARAQMMSLREDGMQKVLSGITSIEEVVRVTSEEL